MQSEIRKGRTDGRTDIHPSIHPSISSSCGPEREFITGDRVNEKIFATPQYLVVDSSSSRPAYAKGRTSTYFSFFSFIN